MRKPTTYVAPDGTQKRALLVAAMIHANHSEKKSTALLLARLEQENAKLATNPKSVKVQAVEKLGSSTPQPPSMAQLRRMVNGPTPSALRFSMLPPPPPMTDLEFYAALVKDYQQTAARLPTLLSNKIRKGIPPPLRGVVWQSMSGARDSLLEEQYDRFCGESSPYELLIGKDLGRSFPGVDMFRDPDGDGQRMLGKVLKSFSLYDTKIGYCQGLAFLVGPLLMHMPDKQAFCVLVRYVGDRRPSFVALTRTDMTDFFFFYLSIGSWKSMIYEIVSFLTCQVCMFEFINFANSCDSICPHFPPISRSFRLRRHTSRSGFSASLPSHVRCQCSSVSTMSSLPREPLKP